jgi:hypothetical protein
MHMLHNINAPLYHIKNNKTKAVFRNQIQILSGQCIQIWNPDPDIGGKKTHKNI